MQEMLRPTRARKDEGGHAQCSWLGMRLLWGGSSGIFNSRTPGRFRGSPSRHESGKNQGRTWNGSGHRDSRLDYAAAVSAGPTRGLAEGQVSGAVSLLQFREGAFWNLSSPIGSDCKAGEGQIGIRDSFRRKEFCELPSRLSFQGRAQTEQSRLRSV